jgi:hypothetical protein
MLLQANFHSSRFYIAWAISPVCYALGARSDPSIPRFTVVPLIEAYPAVLIATGRRQAGGRIAEELALLVLVLNRIHSGHLDHVCATIAHLESSMHRVHTAMKMVDLEWQLREHQEHNADEGARVHDARTEVCSDIAHPKIRGSAIQNSPVLHTGTDQRRRSCASCTTSMAR